jgi:YVTN family beta-propeller protein
MSEILIDSITGLSDPSKVITPRCLKMSNGSWILSGSSNPPSLDSIAVGAPEGSLYLYRDPAGDATSIYLLVSGVWTAISSGSSDSLYGYVKNAAVSPKLLGMVRVNAAMSVPSAPNYLCYSNVNSYVYVSSSSAGMVYVFDPYSNALVSSINVGGTPMSIVEDQELKKLIVADASLPGWRVIDPYSNTVANSYVISGATSVNFASYSPHIAQCLLVGVKDASITVWTLAKGNASVSDTATVYGSSPSITDFIYCPGNNRMLIGLDDPTGPYSYNVESKVSTAMNIGSTSQLCYCPSNNRIYCGANVSNIAMYSVNPGDFSDSYSVPHNSTVSGSEFTRGVCYNPDNGLIYVSRGNDLYCASVFGTTYSGGVATIKTTMINNYCYVAGIVGSMCHVPVRSEIAVLKDSGTLFLAR